MLFIAENQPGEKLGDLEDLATIDDPGERRAAFDRRVSQGYESVQV